MRFQKCLAIAVVLLYLRPGSAQSDPVSCASKRQTAESTKLLNLRRKAETGDASAQYILGNVYVNGSSVLRDYKEAARWYSAAAAQGSASAQFMLGYLFEHGLGVSQDYAEAARQYRAAAEQGHAIAENNLAGLVPARSRCAQGCEPGRRVVSPFSRTRRHHGAMQSGFPVSSGP